MTVERENMAGAVGMKLVGPQGAVRALAGDGLVAVDHALPEFGGGAVGVQLVAGGREEVDAAVKLDASSVN